jgi:hypothetical protein
VNTEDEAQVRKAVLAGMKDLEDEKKAEERTPDWIEICCLILAVIIILGLTVGGAPVWTTPVSLFPNLGKAGSDVFLSLFRK